MMGKPRGRATRSGKNEVNKSGGLLGHQVRLDILDDNSHVDQNQTNYERLIAVDHVNFDVSAPSPTPLRWPGRSCLAPRLRLSKGIGTSPSTFQKGLTNLFAVSLSATKYLHSFVHYVLSFTSG